MGGRPHGGTPSPGAAPRGAWMRGGRGAPGGGAGGGGGREGKRSAARAAARAPPPGGRRAARARRAAPLALLRSADIERRALGNPGRALYLYEELLKRNLAPDLAEMVGERKVVAERALQQSHGPGYGRQPDSANSLFRLSESNR